MVKCEDSENCQFLNEIIITTMPNSVNLYRRLYCEDNVKACARYMLTQAVGSDAVPHDLFPQHRDRAMTILRDQVTSRSIIS